FHPAAALVRRRIKQTRELGCDETVTEKLLDAPTYARSLVRLASSALPPGRTADAITVGVNDADILEERVMKMLARTGSNARRKNLLLIAAGLLLAVPCAAAVSFAPRVSIAGQATARQKRVRIHAVRDAANVIVPALENGEGAATLVEWLKK